MHVICLVTACLLSVQMLSRMNHYHSLRQALQNYPKTHNQDQFSVSSSSLPFHLQTIIGGNVQEGYLFLTLEDVLLTLGNLTAMGLFPHVPS